MKPYFASNNTSTSDTYRQSLQLKLQIRVLKVFLLQLWCKARLSSEPNAFYNVLSNFNDSICSNTKDFYLGRKVFHTLMYADDLILLSETAEDLQSQLNDLNVFTIKVKMRVNLNKTKITLSKKSKWS